MTTKAIEIAARYAEVLTDFFKQSLIGCSGRCYTRVYLDLRDLSLFVSTEVSCNTWLHRDDGSLVEITHDSGWGADLTDEELAWLEQDGLSEFGYPEWFDEIVSAIATVLDGRK